MNFVKLSKLETGRFHFFVFFTMAILLSFLAISLFYPKGLFITGYDGLFHFRRFVSVAEAIEAGRYPFYIDSYSLNGYGYATNLFYSDLFLVPFSFLSQYLGAVFSYKLMLFCTFLSCLCIAYFSLYKMSKNSIMAVVFALLYTFSLYRIADMSMRGSLGELWAFTFLPLVCWGIYEIVYGDFKHKWYILSLGSAGLIFSHMLSSFFVFVFMFCFLVVKYKTLLREPRRIFYIFVAGFCSLLLSSVFLFSFFEQLHSGDFYFQTNPVINIISSHTRSFNRILTGLFKGFSTRDELDFPMMDVGLLLLFPLLFRFFVKEKSRLIKSADVSMLLGIVLLLMMSDFFPWALVDNTKIASLIQFPWRLLFIVNLLFSYSGAVYLQTFVKGYQKYALYLILFVFIVVQMRFTGIAFQEIRWFKEIPSVYITEDSVDNISPFLSVAGGEYVPSKVPSISYIIQRKDTIMSSTDKMSFVSQVKISDQKIGFHANVTEQDHFVMPLIYYKGYKAVMQDEELEVKQNECGLVEVVVPRSGLIEVWFDGTTIQKISFIISIITLILLIVYVIVYDRVRKINL